MMTSERDVELVLVTVAGVSRDLAAPNDHFPLMGDWSSTLSKHLASQGQHLLDLVDLRNVCGYSTGLEKVFTATYPQI